jgi:RNA polymerase I-specific transcription initiation factor RRN3
MEHRERVITTANVFDHFAKSAASSSTSVKSAALVPERVVKKNKENAVGGALAAYSARPIASNSRLRRDEKSRRDVYLAFINNALSEKAKVRLHNDWHRGGWLMCSVHRE